MLDKSDAEYLKLENEENKLAEGTFLTLASSIGLTKEQILKDVKAFYSDYGKDGIVTFQEATKYMRLGNGSKAKRLIVLFYSINNNFGKLHSKSDVVFDKHIETVIKKEFDFVKQKATDKEIGKIKNQKWGNDDLNWRKRLSNDFGKMNNKVLNAVRFNVTTRKTIKTLEKKINKLFDSFKNTIRTLMVTETVATASSSKRAVAKLNGYKYYYWVLKPDACETCVGVSGVFPIDSYFIGVTAPPLHPHCRCVIKFIKHKSDK